MPVGKVLKFYSGESKENHSLFFLKPITKPTFQSKNQMHTPHATNKNNIVNQTCRKPANLTSSAPLIRATTSASTSTTLVQQRKIPSRHYPDTHLNPSTNPRLRPLFHHPTDPPPHPSSMDSSNRRKHVGHIPHIPLVAIKGSSDSASLERTRVTHDARITNPKIHCRSVTRLEEDQSASWTIQRARERMEARRV